MLEQIRAKVIQLTGCEDFDEKTPFKKLVLKTGVDMGDLLETVSRELNIRIRNRDLPRDIQSIEYENLSSN